MILHRAFWLALWRTAFSTFFSCNSFHTAWTVDGRSIWARLFRDSYLALLAHCGGADAVSDTKRMAARRVACLEAELIHLEDWSRQYAMLGLSI